MAAAEAPPDAALAWLALARVEGIGPRRAATLVRAFGDAQAAVAAGRRGAWPRLPGWDRTRSAAVGRAVDVRGAAAEWARGRRLDARLLWVGAAGYPASWRMDDGWPLVLWVRGAWPTAVHQAEPAALAIVGPRRATPAATGFAHDVAASAARAGAWVVSGLAFGVDAAAHRGALQAARDGAPASTVAVLAGGADRPHPAEHRALAREMLAGGGALVTAAPIGASPPPGAFPRRNRWIAGLSGAVAVIEAGPRSGSLHTAAAALELGRDVLTTPARPWDAHAAGSLALLRDGAAPLVAPDDGWRALPAGTLARAPARTAVGEVAPAPWDTVLADGPRTADEAAAAAGWSLPRTLAALEGGVLAGWTIVRPGGRYALRRSACAPLGDRAQGGSRPEPGT